MGKDRPILGFSVRKLKNAKTDRCMKVRRSSDDKTKDIGFSELGVLDVEDLMLFLEGSDGYVETMYGQFTSLNLTQTDKKLQPRIASKGGGFY